MLGNEHLRESALDTRIIDVNNEIHPLDNEHSAASGTLASFDELAARVIAEPARTTGRANHRSEQPNRR